MKKVKSKMARFGYKSIGALALIGCLAISGLNVLSQSSTNALGGGLSQIGTFYPDHVASWANGTAGYGTSVETFEENGSTYYQDGSIIELSIVLPVNNQNVGLADDIYFNPSQVELLSSYMDIGASQDKYYSSNGWSAYVVGENIDETSAVIHYVNDVQYLTPDTHTDASAKLARIYFKVKSGVSTEAGTDITFTFPKWQVTDREFNFMTPNYDPTNSAGTYFTACDPVTVTAKTKTAAPTFPTLNLKADSVNIFEGDLFDPTAQITSVSDSQGNVLDASSVTIGGGDGIFEKHTPVAGTFVYTYSVTDQYGQTTTKDLNVNVVKRTYTITNVDLSDKGIVLDAGANEDLLKSKIDKINKSDFKVTLSCNDGSTLVVDGISTGGTTTTYKIDSKGNLVGDQEFDVTYSLALPIISYDVDGNRTITNYNGSDIVAWNKLSATGSNYDATAKVKVNSSTGGNGSGNTNSGSTGSNDSSTSNGGNGSSANTNKVSTGDTSGSVKLLMLLTMISFGYIGMRTVKSVKK